MGAFKKMDLSQDERRIILKFWERKVTERKNTLDVMTDLERI